MNEQIQKLMKTLNISEAEARQVIEDDRRIDKGEKLFELSAELEAGAKKARQADRKPTEKKSTRKEDVDKSVLMEGLMGAVADYTPTQTKPGEFVFEFNGRKFKVVLSAPRS